MSGSKPLSAEVQEWVARWLSLDRNPTSIAEIKDLVQAGDEAELRSRLGTRIAFTTAGLRGRMTAGFSNINDVTVIQASQGLALHLLDSVSDVLRRGVVIGFDGRHNSSRYARLAASVFLSKKIPTLLFPKPVATPIVACGVKTLEACAGIMITASHNPKDDNGYKVYWSNTAQIIPPHDESICRWIAKHENEIWVWDEDPMKDPLCVDPTEKVVGKYVADSREQLCFTADINPTSPVTIVYTAMHGVGAPFVRKIWEAFRLPPFVPVKEQIDMDPNFTTVKFPNPEEGKGALRLAMETAQRVNGNLILATDPDADRLAVAERNPATGEWKILNGNEIALLFADWLWTRSRLAASPVPPESCVMIASTVSSKVLKAMAKKEGFRFDETLTGFKWIGNAAWAHSQRGVRPLFAYEVEIGFLAGDLAYDKDGVRMAGVFAELANHHAREGRTLASHLHSLYEKYGFFKMTNSYFFCRNPVTMAAIFDRLRRPAYPTACGRWTVQSVRDLTTGFDSAQPDHRAVLPVSSSSHMITFTFTDGSVCTLRGSGTEPKLKFYVETVDADESRAEAMRKELTAAVIDEFLQPARNGLEPPAA